MKYFAATVLSNQQIANGIYEIILDCQNNIKQIQAGQFAHIKLPDSKDLTLMRPLSINSFNQGNLHLVYQVVGEGTRRLSLVQDNTSIYLIAPIGNGFKMLPQWERILLVGGGMGVAPLRAIIEQWPDKEYYMAAGFRTKELIYQKNILNSISHHMSICTDDGSEGEESHVCKLIEPLIDRFSPDAIMTCGPKVVMKMVADAARKYNIPCQVSLEQNMGCGVGACMVCSCKIGREDDFAYKRVCTDGPVFFADEVVF